MLVGNKLDLPVIIWKFSNCLEQGSELWRRKGTCG